VSIFKRGRFYWFHFVYDGQHVQRSTRQSSAAAARQIEAAYRTSLARGEAGITERKSIPSLRNALKDFLLWSEQEHQAHPETYERYRVSSVALLRHFGDVRLNRISAEDVEKFKSRRLAEHKTARAKNKRRRKLEKKLRPATVNRELACLRALFNFVLKSDVVLRNPVSRVKFLQEQNDQTRVLTFAEQKAYLAVATPTLRDVATLMLETGMRPEEVYRIRVENINLSEGWVYNPYGKTKAARRRIALTATAQRILQSRISGAGDFIFPCETDSAKPIPKVSNAHYRALTVSGVAPFRLYDLRHTWATRAAMAGVDLVTLAAMLGHSRIQMVLRYAHPTQQHQKDAMKRIEDFVTTAGAINDEVRE
jgi:integrase